MNTRKNDAKNIKIEVASFFGDKSDEYDSKFVSAPAWQFFFRKFFFKTIPKLKKNQMVVDIGCGTGGNTKPFLRYGIKVTCLDISKEMLKLAKRRLGSGANFVVGDTEYLPLKTSSFDVIICNGVLQYLPQPYNAIKEISRILKMGGLYFGFETHKSIFRPLYEKLSFLRNWSNPYHTSFSAAQLTSWFKKNGVRTSCKVTLIAPPEALNLIYKINKKLGAFILLSSENCLTSIPFFDKLGGGVIITGSKVKML